MNTELSCDLTAKSCKPCEGGVPPMEQAEIVRMLEALNGWEQAGKEIAKTFRFKNYGPFYKCGIFRTMWKSITLPYCHANQFFRS